MHPTPMEKYGLSLVRETIYISAPSRLLVTTYGHGTSNRLTLLRMRAQGKNSDSEHVSL